MHLSLLSQHLLAEKEGALEALLETRTAEALTAAWEFLGEHDRSPIRNVGFEPEDRHFRALHPASVHHIVFPAGFFDFQETPDHLVKRHPTWSLHGGEEILVGGPGTHVCAACTRKGHHFLTLSGAVLRELGITGLETLVLESCSVCLSCATLFYHHEANGTPTPLESAPSALADLPTVPLLPVRARLAPTPARWRWQDHACSNNRENLFRVGGHPTWIQQADFQSCPGCARTMTFLLQIDSGLPSVDLEEVLWGDSGMLYCQWCEACKISGWILQCY